MPRFFTRGYSAIQQGDEPKEFASDIHRLRKRSILFLANIVMFLFSSIVMSCWMHDRYFVLNRELRKTSTWTPIHDLVDLKMKPRLVEGTLFPADKHSIAREMPNEEADKKWAIWEEARMIPISKADVLRLGKDPETAFKLEDSLWGLGDDAYAASLDIFHQLHCLNTLREIAYGGYYNETMGNAKSEELYEVHLNHCVDILLQALQCSGNVNLITLHWTETQPFPHPDFSIHRQCIAFDALSEWNMEHSINRARYMELGVTKPEGQKMEKAPPKLRAWAQEHAGEYKHSHHMV